MSVRSRRVAGGPRSGGAQLEVARSRLSRLRDIERGKYALISHYASLMPQRRPPPGGKESGLRDDVLAGLRPPRRHPHRRSGLKCFASTSMEFRIYNTSLQISRRPCR